MHRYANHFLSIHYMHSGPSIVECIESGLERVCVTERVSLSQKQEKECPQNANRSETIRAIETLNRVVCCECQTPGVCIKGGYEGESRRRR